MRKSCWKACAVGILIAEAVGALSAFISGNIGETYQAFRQPPLSPPGWLFPVVWALLYALMGIAAGLIFCDSAPVEERKTALEYYGIQLVLNFLWSILFFRFRLYWAALFLLGVLDLAVILTILRFRRIRPAAAWLLIPYLIWILFATYLNAGVAFLN